jgi:hypothetical protein
LQRAYLEPLGLGDLAHDAVVDAVVDGLLRGVGVGDGVGGLLAEHGGACAGVAALVERGVRLGGVRAERVDLRRHHAVVAARRRRRAMQARTLLLAQVQSWEGTGGRGEERRRERRIER